MRSIRKAEPKDLDAIYALYSDRYDSHDAPSIKYTKSDWEWYLNNDHAIILLLESNNKILGLTFTYDMGLWGYMEHVVVKKGHRKKGYAKMLIEHTMEIGVKRGWRIFEACYYAEIEAMGKFFKSIGWQDGGINTRWVFLER